MLIISGRPETAFATAVLSAIREIAGIDAILLGGVPIPGNKTEVVIKNFFPAKHTLGPLLVSALGSYPPDKRTKK